MLRESLEQHNQDNSQELSKSLGFDSPMHHSNPPKEISAQDKIKNEESRVSF